MSSYHYRAFVSYSHRDSAWTKWLLRSLETYKVPKHIVGTTGRNGVIESRLGRFFRDKEELAAGGDLDSKIIGALEKSESLIVVCSPNSAQSKSVNREVQYFRDIRGDEHIFYIIKSGVPNADAMGAPASQECFPPALMGRSIYAQSLMGLPLAADARPEGDGRKVALLKIVAGLIGIPYDKLVRRDLQRRNRRLLQATTILAASGLIAIGLALQAFYATRQAENALILAEQRQEDAEGLIQFMLAELHFKLKKSAELGAMESVYRRVAAYYDTQDLQDLSVESRMRRAEALEKIAQVYNIQGAPDKAENLLRRVLNTTRSLVQSRPNDANLIDRHIMTLFTLGNSLRQKGELQKAYGYFQERLEYARILESLEPADYLLRTRIADANFDMGALKLDLQSAPDAAKQFIEEGFEQRLALLDLARNYPEFLPNAKARVGEGYYYLSLLQAYTGQLDLALQTRQLAVDIYRQRILDDFEDIEGRHLYYRSLRQHAELMIAAGNTETAIARAEEASQGYASLFEDGFALNSWREQQAIADIDLASYQLVSGRPNEAEARAALALSRLEALVGQTSPVIARLTRIMRARTLLAACLLAGNNLDRAQSLLEKTSKALSTVPKQHLQSLEGRRFQADFYALRADLFTRLGAEDRAAENWQAIIDLFGRHPASFHPSVRHKLAEAYIALNQETHAEAIIADLTSINYLQEDFVKKTQEFASRRVSHVAKD